MIDSRRNHRFSRKSRPERRPLRAFAQPDRTALTCELQKYMHTLGPMPKRCLETFVDLGLTDAEIARYFKVPGDVVTQLRDVWDIGGIT